MWFPNENCHCTQVYLLVTTNEYFFSLNCGLFVDRLHSLAM